MAYGHLCVNKSNLTVPVWENDDFKKQIGVIYPREVYAVYPMYGEGLGLPIRFLNSQGQLVDGYIQMYADYFNDIDVIHAFCSGVGDYPYDKLFIFHYLLDGKEYYDGNLYITFIFRRTMNVYTAAGRYWGRVAAGMRVACRADSHFFRNGSGQNNPHWKAINYVERSTDRAWIKVTGDGKDYGFVDSGLAYGSSPSTIPMYGSW